MKNGLSHHKNRSANKNQIIRNYAITSLLVAALIAAIFLSNYEKGIADQKILTIDSEISRINEEYNELQSKSADIKKYVSMWENIGSNKKVVSGIRLDDINTLVGRTAERYFVSDPQVNVSSIPQVVQGGIFNCKTVTVIFTKVSLTFSAVTDIKALMFIDDLFSRIPGYGIITNLEISKAKDYTTDD